MADGAVEYLKMPSPEEALAVPVSAPPHSAAQQRTSPTARLRRHTPLPQAPVIGSARADELIKWLWETAQFRPDYPACSIDYFAEDVVYEDMVYKDPFIGKPAVSTMLAEAPRPAPPRPASAPARAGSPPARLQRPGRVKRASCEPSTAAG